jgi:hypothetical protein
MELWTITFKDNKSHIFPVCLGLFKSEATAKNSMEQILNDNSDFHGYVQRINKIDLKNYDDKNDHYTVLVQKLKSKEFQRLEGLYKTAMEAQKQVEILIEQEADIINKNENIVFDSNAFWVCKIEPCNIKMYY